MKMTWCFVMVLFATPALSQGDDLAHAWNACQSPEAHTWTSVCDPAHPDHCHKISTGFVHDGIHDNCPAVETQYRAAVASARAVADSTDAARKSADKDAISRATSRQAAPAK